MPRWFLRWTVFRYIYIYRSLLFERGRESKLGTNNKSDTDSRDFILSSSSEREKKRKKRKISGTKDFWRTKKTYEKTPTIGTFKEKIRYVCFDSFFAFLQPR